VRDANLKQTKALPNGANTIYTDAFDLGAQSGKQACLAQCELLISAPALVVGDLADAATMKYGVQCDNDAAFGSPKTLALEALVQTGAGGAGAAAAKARFRLPSDCERYVRISAVNSGAGDASDKSVTVELLF
jgi:hypothetical protein